MPAIPGGNRGGGAPDGSSGLSGPLSMLTGRVGRDGGTLAGGGGPASVPLPTITLFTSLLGAGTGAFSGDPGDTPTGRNREAFPCSAAISFLMGTGGPSTTPGRPRLGTGGPSVLGLARSFLGRGLGAGAS